MGAPRRSVIYAAPPHPPPTTMSGHHAGQSALFIDLENFVLGREENWRLEQDHHPGDDADDYDCAEDLRDLITFATRLAGPRSLAVKRAYANYNVRRENLSSERWWDYYLQGVPNVLLGLGVEPVQVFRFPGGKNKNASDPADGDGRRRDRRRRRPAPRREVRRRALRAVHPRHERFRLHPAEFGVAAGRGGGGRDRRAGQNEAGLRAVLRPVRVLRGPAGRPGPPGRTADRGAEGPADGRAGADRPARPGPGRQRADAGGAHRPHGAAGSR